MALASYWRETVELSSLTVLTATEDGVTVEAVDATVDTVKTVDLTALSRLSSCRELSMTVDTCCRAVEPGLSRAHVRGGPGKVMGTPAGAGEGPALLC